MEILVLYAYHKALRQERSQQCLLARTELGQVAVPEPSDIVQHNG